MASDPRQGLTIEEYLAFERASETKHDYFDGEIFDSASGAKVVPMIANLGKPPLTSEEDRRHNRLAINIATELQFQLEDRDCEVYARDLRVRTPQDFFIYPDVVVVCGPPDFDNAPLDTLLNPTVIVEVVSPSTADYDRGTKLLQYRAIPSLTEIIVLAQDSIHVEHYLRRGRHEWLLRETEKESDILRIPALGCVLDLRRVYRRVFE